MIASDVAVELSDAELLERWRADDRAAGNQLISRHYKPLFRFLVGRTSGNADAAAELTQRVFEVALRKQEKIGDNFRAFVFGVARLKLLEHYRIRPTEPPPAELLDNMTSPSGKIAKAQEENIVARALRKLSIDDQILIDLKDHESLKAHEIAAIMGDASPKGQNSIRGRISRARARLRHEVEQLVEDPELRDATLRRIDSWHKSLMVKYAQLQPEAHERATGVLGREDADPSA
jgi:RNA polymerase sigma factor (sigma-70 family)